MSSRTDDPEAQPVPPPGTAPAASGHRASPLSVRRVWCSAFVVFALLGIVWAYASPVLASPDETVHAAKAVALVRGQVLGTERVVSERDPHLLNGVFTTYEVPRGYSELGVVPACYAFYPKIPANCSPGPPEQSGGAATTEVYNGRYPPLYYALVGWPSLLAGPAAALPLMRVLSALIAAALLATAAAAIVDLPGRRRMVVVGFALAVPPSVLFIGASVNPSAVEVTAGLAVWTSTLALLAGSGRPSRSLVVRTAAVMALFVLSRPVSPVFLAIVVVLVALAVGSVPRVRELWADRFTRWTAVGGIAVAALASLFVLGTKSFSGQQGFPLVDKSKGDIAALSLGELPWRTRQLIGVFGWLDTPLNPAAILAWLGLVLVLVVAGLVFGSARVRLALVGTAVALVVVPLAAELVGAANIGTVWQGRYSLPLAVGLPLLAGFGLDRSRRVATRATSLLVVPVAIFVAAVGLLGVITSVRRYATGADHPLLDFLGTNVWQPAGGPWLYLVAAVATATLYGLWVAWFARAGDA